MDQISVFPLGIQLPREEFRKYHAAAVDVPGQSLFHLILVAPV